MIKEKRKFFLQLLGLGGVISSAATIYALPLPKTPTLMCGIEALSCTTALTSKFSTIGGVPLGVFGVMYFIFLTLGMRAFHRTGLSEYIVPVTWLVTAGVIGSIGLGSIMFFVLKAPCLYCLITHTVNILYAVLFWPYRAWRMPRIGGDPFWHWAAIGGIAVLAGTTIYFANEKRILEARLAIAEESQTESLF